MMKRAGLALCAASLLGAPAFGQSSAPVEIATADLRSQQEAIFAAMLQDPDNLELMFNHALTSIALKDFEAAISTLERMLIFNPRLARAKVELGAAYFRLGAYESARFYFEDVLAQDNPPPEVRRRIDGFLSEIDRRTRKSGASATVVFGVTYNSNANLGPPDENVLINDIPATLNEEFVEADDFGFRASLSGRHFVDLNQPNGDVWLTEASLFGLHYLEETQGDIDSLSFKTGPRLSIGDKQFGPKIRPFAYGDLVRADNDLLYYTIGGGVEYFDTLSDKTNIFASAQTGWREYVETSRRGFDGTTHRVNAGIAFAPNPSLTLSGLGYGEMDLAADDFNSNIEIGGRIGAVYRYDSGLAFTDRLWSASAFVGAAYRDYFEAGGGASNTISREDFDIRAGVSHVFNLSGGWFVQAEADILFRDSNVPNFDVDNIGGALSIGRSF